MYILVTNIPTTRTNWLAPYKTKIAHRGSTSREAWWYASSSLDKLKALRNELKSLNPHAKPPIKTRLRQVQRIPKNYL